MSMPRHVTRFAPSPSGQLHLGNARTALFNALAARAGGGCLVLRIEDTDAERSSAQHARELLQDLAWLGLRWDEGPDIGGPSGSYRQSERGAGHASAMQRLRDLGLSYPCFCTPQELQVQRRQQLAAGRPPRYAGTCAALSAEEIAERHARGLAAATRFRVPPGHSIEFVDAIHGPQAFRSDDIGDFVIGRADGSAAFFLSNALDDAQMGVTLVLRGDDHLANTPRQILILRALQLAEPEYGHLPLVLAPDGAPLSKRSGAASLRELREGGYLPEAICNYLARLGHSGGPQEFATLDTLAAGFRLDRISHSAAHVDEEQLRHWQRVAVAQADEAQLAQWMAPRLDALPPALRAAFVRAVRGNVLFPDDVLPMLQIVAAGELHYSADARVAIAAAGAGFFATARAQWSTPRQPLKDWARALASASGRRGADLYLPLRAALTGETHGPELAPLLELLEPSCIERRLLHAEALAAATAPDVSTAT